MGCNPSKESQVATGNTVKTTPNLQKKKSNVSKNSKTEEITSTVTPLPANKTNDVTTNDVKDNDDIEEKEEEEKKEENELGIERVEEIKNVSVMDVQENNNKEEETEEITNVIAPDSPDQFFSTRKDEVPVEIFTVPLVEKLEADDVPEKDVLVEEVTVEDQEMKVEKEGEPSSSKDSADLKDTILVKEEEEP